MYTIGKDNSVSIHHKNLQADRDILQSICLNYTLKLHQR